MNRNACCTQNMGPHGARNNMGQARCAMPVKEPVRPCMENRMGQNRPCMENHMNQNRPCMENRMGQNHPCTENHMRHHHQDMGQDRVSSPCTCEEDWKQEVPTGNQKKLLCYIDEVSFAVYDALLYLDTHPNDDAALHYFNRHNMKRNFALEEYAKAYGPLNIGTMDDDAGRSWEWACQPWPWEGGNC